MLIGPWKVTGKGLNMNTSKFGEHADKIGHWNDGPETFVVIKAKDLQLGVQTYGPPLPDLSPGAFLRDMKIISEKTGWNFYEATWNGVEQEWEDMYTNWMWLSWLQGKQS